MTKANVVKMDPLRVKPFPQVTMLALSSLKPAEEAPKELGLQVRRSNDQEGLPTLEASVRVHGIIVPLVVQSHDDHVYVVAGNRRLKVLRQIHGDIDVLVPTVEAARFDGDTREIAMATNIALPPHPVDRYEVMAQLVEEGMTPDDAKHRFGMDDRQFAQTMKLGRLTPMIRDKWRAGEISGETAQAFTLAGTEQEQEKLYKRIEKTAWDHKVAARDVRAAIVPANQREVGALVEFVGVETCEKLGLIKQRDWFATSHFVTDVKKLKHVASEKLDLIQDSFIKEGWSFCELREKVENVYAYGRETPNKKGEFSLEQKKRSGVFLRISEDGTLETDLGRIEPKAAQKAKRKEKTKPKKDEEPEISAALKFRLQQQLQAAGAELLRTHHDVAISALIAGFASGGDIINATIARPGAKPGSFATAFQTVLKASREERAAMLAQIAANAIEPCDLDDKGVAAMFSAMKPTAVNTIVFTKFDAVGYFESISHAMIVEAVGEAMGRDHATKVGQMKKADAVKFASANLKHWLPSELRTSHYRGKK